jgi:hypothetical protein
MKHQVLKIDQQGSGLQPASPILSIIAVRSPKVAGPYRKNANLEDRLATARLPITWEE